MTTGADWFGRLYAEGYRGLLLTAYAMLEDQTGAAAVTRDALAVAYERRVRLGQEEHPLEWVRAEVVRRARRWRQRRALPHRPAVDRDGEAVRLHRLAGLPPEVIASIVDLPVDAVAALVAEAGPVSWASVRQPVVAAVLVRSAQRTTRKRMLAVAAVAVVLLAVAVPLLRVGSGPPPAAATPPPSTTWTPPPRQLEKFVYDVKFADDRHAYALRASCAGPDCDLELLASVDGGRWSSHPVRKPPVNGASIGQLIALGPEEVAVDWWGPSATEAYRMHTADSGRTWDIVPAEPRGSVPEIPAGAALEPACVDRTGACDEETLQAVVPGSAQTVLLPSGPRLRQAFPGPVPLEGGRWWVVGIVPGTLRWAIGVSDDNGRTWTVSAPAPARKNINDSWSVTAYGDDLYACATGEVSNGEYAMIAIFHSGDGGRSWQRTNARPPAGTGSSLVAAADGTVRTSTELGGTLVSHDHGRTFTETDKRFTGYVYWSGIGYVTAPNPGQPIMFSPDGLRWHDLELRS